MSGHDPVSSGNALTTHSPHSPPVAPSGTSQYGSLGSERQSTLVVHGAPCPSTGETKSSVTVDTAKRNAARLAPLLCSERISPLLCRCFFLLFLGRRGRRRRLLACASSDGDQTLSEGTAAHLHLVFSRCLHPFSPLFDATTIAHNARPVISVSLLSRGHFAFHF